MARRDQNKLAQRLRRANFRSQKTLECFDFDRLPGLNRALVHELATGRFLAEKVAVLIVGPCGTGKSHLAQAIGHLIARQGHDVLFATQSQLLASLRQAQAVGTYERRFHTLAHVPLLIIDDFGLKPLRPPEDETFHDLMAERYERAATLLTSNPAFRLKLSQILFSTTRCTPVHASCPELMRQFLPGSPSPPGPQKCGRHRAYRSRPVPFSQICPERALALTWR